MPRVELTPEQREAVYAPGNVLVRAGAGAGKTEVLAQRFVALLAGDIGARAPLEPERIAAITFTEKATADMRRRIAETLDDKIAHKADGTRRKALLRARRTLGLARISTIHAFCARLLREYPIEARVDPAFDVLDEYASQTFLESASRELIADAVRAKDRGAYRLVRARGLYGTTHREGALEIVVRLVGAAARLGNSPQWLRETSIVTAEKLDASAAEIVPLRGELAGLVDRLLASPGISGAAGERLRDLQGKWPALRSRLGRIDADADLPALGALEDLRGELPKAQNAAIKDAVKEIHATVKRLHDNYGAGRAAQAIRETAQFVAKIAEDLEARKRTERVLTFDDLLVLARRLLEDHPEIAVHYRRSLGALLVDEYQDTDNVQDAVVRLLTEGSRPAPELFLVGDEKQSIYRFRGADVTVFKRPRPLDPLMHRPLRENRRSLPAIVDFVNAVSAIVMSPGEDGDKPYRVSWSDEHRLRPIRPAANTPAVELIVAPLQLNPGEGKQPGTHELRRAEADAIARRCAGIVAHGVRVANARSGIERPARFGDIALLLRSFTDVATYENAFSRAAVPSYTVRGRGFFGCKEVRDLAALLSAIDDPQDTIALAAVLRSPLFGLSDQCLLEMAIYLGQHRAAVGGRRRLIGSLFDDPDENFPWLGIERESALNARRVLVELRAMRERAPLSEILERALELTRFEAVMLSLDRGSQRAANVRKLLDIARDFEAHRFFGLEDFARHLRRLADEEPREPQAQIVAEAENAVRLMTIHQAKGLEFPIVIVADLGRRPPPNNEKIVMTPEDGLLMCDTVGAGDDELPNPQIDRYRERIKDQERAESARILYVAMTRARDRLILSEGPSEGEWTRRIREAIGADLVAHFAESANPEEIVGAAGIKVVLSRVDCLAAGEAAVLDRKTETTSDELARMAAARLGFALPAGRELLTSPSALEDFERCPRQYFLRHELALPENGIGIFRANNRAEAMGNVAHAVLAQLNPHAAHNLDAEIARLVDIHCAGVELNAAQRKGLILDLVRYVRGSEVAAAPSACVRRETPFFMTLEDRDLTLLVRGRIDALSGDGARLIVSDYKYARPGPGDYRVQMECYALAAADALPGRTVDAEIIYLRDGGARRALALPSPAAIRTHLLEIGHRIAKARADGTAAGFPKRPAEALECRRLGCGYVARCWPGGQPRAT